MGCVPAEVTPEQLHPGVGVGRPAVHGEAHLGPEGEGAPLADEQLLLLPRLLFKERVLLRMLRPRVSGEEAVLGGDEVATLALEMRLPGALFTYDFRKKCGKGPPPRQQIYTNSLTLTFTLGAIHK